MKLFLVTILLAFCLFTLIASIDLLIGISANGVIWKALNPFKVMESAEYFILFIFILFYIFEIIGAYLNKRQGDNPPSK